MVQVLSSYTDCIVVTSRTIIPASRLPSRLDIRGSLLDGGSPCGTSMRARPVRLVTVARYRGFLRGSITAGLL